MVELKYPINENELFEQDYNAIPAAIVLAYRHCKEINEQGNRWCRLEVMIQPDGHLSVMNYIGIIMSNGKKEICMRIRQYGMNGNEVIWYDSLQS